MAVECLSFVKLASLILGCLKIVIGELSSLTFSIVLEKNVMLSKGWLIDWVEIWLSKMHSSFNTSFCFSPSSRYLGLPSWWVSLLNETMARLSFTWMLSWARFSFPIAFACFFVPETFCGHYHIIIGPIPFVVKVVLGYFYFFPLGSGLVPSCMFLVASSLGGCSSIHLLWSNLCSMHSILSCVDFVQSTLVVETLVGWCWYVSTRAFIFVHLFVARVNPSSIGALVETKAASWRLVLNPFCSPTCFCMLCMDFWVIFVACLLLGSKCGTSFKPQPFWYHCAGLGGLYLSYRAIGCIFL